MRPLNWSRTREGISEMYAARERETELCNSHMFNILFIADRVVYVYCKTATVQKVYLSAEVYNYACALDQGGVFAAA